MQALHTLKKNKEFAYVYRRGKSVQKKDFTLIYVKSRYGGVRVGFSVSKKVGNSVERNRVRRRLKEAVREVLDGAQGNYSLILVARQHCVVSRFGSLVQQTRDALVKAGICSEAAQVAIGEEDR